MALTKQVKYKDSSGNEQLIDIGVDAKNVESNTFTQATARANLASGDKLPTIFGKLMKWFADLKTVAWTGSYNDLTNKPTMGGITGTVAVTQGGTGATTASQARVNLGVGAAGTYSVANNCTTTAAGYALDARQGKALMDKANQINSDLGTCRFGITADGKPGWKEAGADTVIPFKECNAILFTSSPVNVAQYTNKWASLTAADFYVGSTGCSADLWVQGDYRVHGTSFSTAEYCPKAYDPSTGILTFSGAHSKRQPDNSQYIIAKSYGTVFAVLLMP